MKKVLIVVVLLLVGLAVICAVGSSLSSSSDKPSTVTVRGQVEPGTYLYPERADGTVNDTPSKHISEGTVCKDLGRYKVTQYGVEMKMEKVDCPTGTGFIFARDAR